MVEAFERSNVIMRIWRYTIGTAVLALAFSGSALADDPATKELYKKKCAVCHGADGKPTPAGTKMGAKDFSDAEVAKAKDADWIEVTAKGKGKMPGYAKSLTEDQIKKLVAEVRAMSKAKK